MDDFSRQVPFKVTKVLVSDPRQVGEGMNTHTVYNVSSVCELTHSQGKPVEFNVSRRYKDFLWLHRTLFAQYKGLMIPPIPDKKILGNNASKHIQKRQSQLNVFLNRVASHASLSEAEELFNFLSSGEDEFKEPRKAEKSNSSSKSEKASSLFSMTGSYLKDQLKNLSSAFVSIDGYARNEEDIRFDDMFEYNEGLFKALGGCHKAAGDLVGCRKELSEGWFELGLKLVSLGEVEVELGELGERLKVFSQGMDRVSVLETDLLEGLDEELEEMMTDLIKLSSSAQKMMEDRNGAFKRYLQALSMLESSRSKANQLKEKNKMEKYRAQEDVVAEHIALVDERKLFLDGVTESSFREFELFKVFKDDCLEKLMIRYVRAQIEHSKKMINVWEDVLVSLQ